MPVATKLSRVGAHNEEFNKFTQSFDQVVLQGHMKY